MLKHLVRHRLAIGIALGLLAAAEVRAQPSLSLDEYLCLRGVPTRHVERALRFTPLVE